MYEYMSSILYCIIYRVNAINICLPQAARRPEANEVGLIVRQLKSGIAGWPMRGQLAIPY